MLTGLVSNTISDYKANTLVFIVEDNLIGLILMYSLEYSL
nr:MAG TPA: hypothetical protein [Caudoviricetes sp.]